ncbi:MAG: hypothetical protein IJ617_06645, partial [Oscillospiraceae bacterium]|nr:hypothetical protein [Oscillospiraceae bacterium]
AEAPAPSPRKGKRAARKLRRTARAARLGSFERVRRKVSVKTMCGNNNCLWIIIILIVLFCGCGNGNGFCGNNNCCDNNCCNNNNCCC